MTVERQTPAKILAPSRRRWYDSRENMFGRLRSWLKKAWKWLDYSPYEERFRLALARITELEKRQSAQTEAIAFLNHDFQKQLDKLRAIVADRQPNEPPTRRAHSWTEAKALLGDEANVPA